MDVIEEGVQPYAFLHRFKGSSIFCFTGRSSDSLLFVCIPWDSSRSQGKGITANTVPSIQTVSPVRVSEVKEVNVVTTQTEFKFLGSFQISYNSCASEHKNVCQDIKTIVGQHMRYQGMCLWRDRGGSLWGIDMGSSLGQLGLVWVENCDQSIEVLNLGPWD